MSRCDVVVMGGGLAGLSAARDLARDGVDVVAARGAQPRRRARGADPARRRAAGAARRRGGRSLPRGLLRARGRARADARAVLSPAAGRGHVGADRRPRGGRRLRMDERRRPRQLRRPRTRRSASWRPPSTPTTRGLTPTPTASIGSRWVSGCASRGRPRAPCAPATSPCSRWRPSRWSAPRCCPTSARRRPRAPTASTTTRSGSACAWPRGRPRWRCAWRRSSATGCATPLP